VIWFGGVGPFADGASDDWLADDGAAGVVVTVAGSAGALPARPAGTVR